ncbi:phage major capsid protein [Anaerorhabdus sp.]|uniref:phage major capsid protein n=2 Tax=Anaerorhabdus sp. TaxID=1872524 RepID=UPI002FC70CEC
MNLEQIEKRLSEIRTELDGDVVNERMDELEAEVASLQEERTKLLEVESAKVEAQSKRRSLLDEIAKGKSDRVVETKEERKEDKKMENIQETKEYRNAWLKNLQKKELTDEEKRTLTSAADSVGSVIPTDTQNLIVELVKQEINILDKIELLQVDGNVTFNVEVEGSEAIIHQEGTPINEGTEGTVPVSLTTYEVNKYITISKTVSKMAIDAFEGWLSRVVARRIANKIKKLVFFGTGTNQSKGIDVSVTWDETNSITVAKDAKLTTQNVWDLIALLDGAFDANAEFTMSKKTLFQDFMPLQDQSKNKLVTNEGKQYYISGYPVNLDSDIKLHDAFLGDFKYYVGNMPDGITIEAGRVLKNNVYEFLGTAMFDGKLAVDEAFVKLTKATA